MALTKRGYAPIKVSGPGISQGARLKATNGPAAGKLIAVRTSQDRELGLLRHPNKNAWRGISKVHEVVVAVPSLAEPDAIEIYCFDAQAVGERFDAALKAPDTHRPSLKAPVFVALDDVPQPGSQALASGLEIQAKWRDEIPINAVTANPSDNPHGFAAEVDRLKREFADRNGVDVSKVVIEFRIVM